MDYYKSLQCRALAAAIKPDREDWLKYVFRCYSKWFSTPLHLVPKLPLEDVLSAYYEELFEQMEEGDRQLHLERLTETDEEQEERERIEEENSDDAFMETMGKEVEKDMENPTPKAKRLARKNKKKEEPVLAPEASLPDPGIEEPIIDMKWDSNNLLSEEFLMSDPLGKLRPGK